MKNILRKTIILILALMLIISMSSFAFADTYFSGVKSGKCGVTDTWTLSSTGELTIWGDGEMANYDYSESSKDLSKLPAPWLEYADMITKLVVKKQVKSIGDYSFAYLKNLETVEIGEGVKKIGAYAFYKCSKLGKVVLPNSTTTISKYAFADSGITEISIPKGVKTFENFAFYGCDNLKIVRIQDIEAYMKSDEKGNESAYPFVNGAALYGYPKSFASTFTDLPITELKIPAGIAKVNNYLFDGCTSISKINIPYSVKEIGISSFKNCSSLTDIEIPKNIKKIWDTAFYGCSSLKSVKFNEGLVIINKGAFQNDGLLEEITLPESLISVGNSAFASCKGLKNVKVLSDGTIFGTQAFGTHYIKASNVKKTSIKISWPVVENVVRTEITLGKDLVATIDGNSNGKYTLTDLAPNTQYKLLITSYFDDKTNFTCATPISTKLNSGLLGELTTKNKTISAIWLLQGRADYQLQIAQNKDFTKKKKEYIVEAGTNQYTFKKLKKGTTYYVRERAILHLDSGDVYGPWSNVEKKKCK